jgi:hypothetical protein
MNRVVAGVLAGMMGLAGVSAAAAAPQETQSARGIVSAVSGDSLTVTVKDQPMKFVVDATTDVVAPGGGTMARAAKAEGKKGVAITSIVKAGQTVEVQYHQPAMHAAVVRVISAAAPGASAPTMAKPETAKPEPAEPKAKSSTTAGQVTAVSGSSLTVKTATGEASYHVDGTTRVIGTGLGTKAREDAAVGKKPTLAEVVAVGDTVSITAAGTAGTPHASEVRVTKKGK